MEHRDSPDSAMGNQPLDLFPELLTESLHMSSQEPAWRRLWELAEVLLGSTERLKKECAILKRLVQQFGPGETERFLRGAQLMRWTSLTSLGSADGLGRRIALAKFWQNENTHPLKGPQSFGAILRKAMAQP